MQIKIFEELDACDPEWRELERTAPIYPFQRREWLRAWQETIGRHIKVRPMIACVYAAGGEPALLCPLGLQTSFGLRRLVWLGKPVSDYQGPLISPRFEGMQPAGGFPVLWQAILDKLRRIDLIDFAHQPADFHGRENPFLTLPHTVHPYEAHAAQLSGNWPSYYRNHAGSSYRESMRRKNSGLAKLGAVELRIADSEQRAAEWTELMLAHKKKQYEGLGLWPAMEPLVRSGFYQQATRALEAAGLLHLSVLMVGDDVAAVHWGIADGKTFYWLMPTYDRERWGRYSPGVILLERLMEWCLQQGFTRFDFTVGNESYKDRWATIKKPIFATSAALTLKGKGFVAIRRLREKLRK
ncbi:MAG: GNAT family N-acetyltransferase [Verrucomicrobiota bacterium]|nr:GNAT family N-acetyltransferase [Verrucomicrobiota bacterium]